MRNGVSGSQLRVSWRHGYLTREQGTARGAQLWYTDTARTAGTDLARGDHHHHAFSLTTSPSPELSGRLRWSRVTVAVSSSALNSRGHGAKSSPRSTRWKFYEQHVIFLILDKQAKVRGYGLRPALREQPPRRKQQCDRPKQRKVEWGEKWPDVRPGPHWERGSEH